MDVGVGTHHQIDMIGPRHLFGGVEFSALNLIDVGSHAAGNDILESVRPPLVAASLARIWSGIGIPKVAQFDNHSNFRGGIQPAYQPPTRLPTQGRIEVVRYIRSNRRVDLFGKRISVEEDQTHQYVTAIIKVRSKKVIVVSLDGEIIHHGDYQISRILR